MESRRESHRQKIAARRPAPQLMAKLVFIGDKFPGRVYEIVAHRTTVGRADHNTLSIHDSSVSEHHCEIYDNGSDLLVHDLGSRNGTVVNGEHLQNAQRPLAHGQIVKFGAIAARLEISQSLSPDTDITAVHFHARESRQPPQDKLPPPFATLDDGTPLDASDHTLILPRPAANRPLDSVKHLSPRSKSKSKTAIVVSLAALGVALMLWLGLRR
jgi:predicted component of type VI protein secretion system